MKNIIRIAAFVLFLSVAIPASSAMVSSAALPVKMEDARGQELLQRLQTIRSMNKSELTRTEKKSLRKEVKAIKKEMRATSGGVYLSVGAVIIIILLLILIL